MRFLVVSSFWSIITLFVILRQYDSRDNCNAIIEATFNTLIAGCQDTTIPNCMTSIGDYAFYNCSGLQEAFQE